MTKQDTMTISALPPYGSEIPCLTWGEWIKAGAVLVKREFMSGVYFLIDWSAAYEERRKLAEMDRHVLKDIGVSRTDALEEASKPFWQK